MISDTSLKLAHEIEKITRVFPVIFISILLIVSGILLTIFIFQMLKNCFQYSELTNLKRKVNKKEAQENFAKFFYLSLILFFAACATLLYGLQQIQPNNPNKNCTTDDVDFIGFNYVYFGLSHICIDTMISSISLFTIFLQKTYSKQKDFNMLKALLPALLFIKLPFLVLMGAIQYPFMWLDGIVILLIYLDFTFLIKSEMCLYKLINENLKQSKDLTPTKLWKEKKSKNLKIFLLFFAGIPFLFLILPLNWMETYLEIVEKDCIGQYLLFWIYAPQSTLKYSIKVLSIAANLLFIPLLILIFSYLVITLQFLWKSLFGYCQERRGADELEEKLLN